MADIAAQVDSIVLGLVIVAIGVSLITAAVFLWWKGNW